MRREVYEVYMRSKEWFAFRNRYLRSDMPKLCIVCGAGPARITFHHLTYLRFGHELLTDVVPLCRKHHDQLHDSEFHRDMGAPLHRLRQQLKQIFGMSALAISERLKPWAKAFRRDRKKFLRKKKRAEREERLSQGNRRTALERMRSYRKGQR